MALLIQNILPRSLAARSGIKAGDIILSINGHKIQDFFDLQFYSSDYLLDFELQDAKGNSYKTQVTRENTKALGIEPETYHCRFCQNRCVFCFIDQMPPNLRDTLYVKDDDFLYSFVFGNYITLTNLRNEDFQRISNQHISPLYVSVHTTDSGLRKQMMHYRQDFEIVPRLRSLSAKGIEFHFQIVVVPDYNDGETLKETIRTLLHPKIKTLSIGLVPVGLTKFREGLPQLIPFDKSRAQAVLDISVELRAECQSDKVFAADEIYVLSGNPIPPQEYYQDFPQLENGIGMIRLTLENFHHKKRSFIRELKRKMRPILFITGISAAGHIQEIADYVNKKLEGNFARVQAIQNDFMGRSITVSGLLTAKDIAGQIQIKSDEILAMPNNIFNHEGITLDGLSQLELKEKLGCDIMVIDHLFEDWDWI